MSKGISKTQAVILGLLRGTEKKQVYRGVGGPMDTAEIAAELEERQLLNYDQPRKLRLFTVRRACDSLLRRGLIESRYILDVVMSTSKRNRLFLEDFEGRAVAVTFSGTFVE